MSESTAPPATSPAAAPADAALLWEWADRFPKLAAGYYAEHHAGFAAQRMAEVEAVSARLRALAGALDAQAREIAAVEGKLAAAWQEGYRHACDEIARRMRDDMAARRAGADGSETGRAE